MVARNSGRPRRSLPSGAAGLVRHPPASYWLLILDAEGEYVALAQALGVQPAAPRPARPPTSANRNTEKGTAR